MRENKKPWDPWTDDEIRDLYDMNPGIDMQQLALVTMLSIAELKQILMENQSFDDYLSKDHAQCTDPDREKCLEKSSIHHS